MFSDIRRCRTFFGFPVLLAILQPLIICPGCSVKEDRESCPCLLEMDFREDGILSGGIPESGILLDMAGSSGRADGYSLKDTSYMRSWRGNVPKGSLWIAASVMENDDTSSVGIVSGTAAALPPAVWTEIRPGRQCPPIWMSCMEVSTDGDMVKVPVSLHKNYCRLSLLITDESGSPFPFRLEVRGNVCGYHIDGTPVEGEFAAPAEYLDPSAAGRYETEILLPRQINDGLRLDIISGDDSCRTFAVGNYIASSGYDWTSADLRDITLEIDYAETALTFRIGRWEKTVQFEVVI